MTMAAGMCPQGMFSLLPQVARPPGLERQKLGLQQLLPEGRGRPGCRGRHVLATAWHRWLAGSSSAPSSAVVTPLCVQLDCAAFTVTFYSMHFMLCFQWMFFPILLACSEILRVVVYSITPLKQQPRTCVT
jgi:hypothetical protein